MTTTEVPACWGWQEIKQYLTCSNIKCGRAKALDLLRACPYSKSLNYQGQRFVLASDFIQWLGTVKDLRNVG